nr:type II pantothenate kinase [Neobacillus sp. Marseille-Q6967]
MKQIKAGIDAGGTLIKIAFIENDRFHFKKYPITEMHQAVSWLKLVAPSVKAVITGGKSQVIQEKYFPTSRIIPEFQATCKGAKVFLAEEKKALIDSYLLVNIGTGTSWHIVKGEKHERILGSGMGGGTFTGLGSLLSSTKDYKILTILANEGEKGKVDLLVKDIYESAETPINGDLTAANFAKGVKADHKEADLLASLTNMIAETTVLLTMQAAALHQVKDVIFIGSTLAGNPSLRGGLEHYMDMAGLTSLFLSKGEYCGAMGACLSV